MWRNFLTKQFLLFLAVGGSAAVVNWLSRFIVNIWVSFDVAVAIAYFFGMIVAFIMNSFFVFPNSTQPITHQIKVFVITNLTFLPIVWGASLTFKFVLTYLGFTFYTHAIAHGLALGVPMFATFLIYKFIAFKDTSL